MLIQIANILNSDELAEIRDRLARVAFEDGRATAGWNAKLVKDNEQASAGAELEAIRASLSAKIFGHEVFALAARPKALTPLLIARYGAGKHYGSHVDDALMRGMRTDVSFTLFLADPDSYDGGELVIETSAGDDAIKLAAGSLVAYPSTSLHRVEPVVSGTRMVAVGWARSFIRSAEQRELLFDLETARRQLFQREGKSREFDLMSKTAANLLRMWAED